MTGEHPVDFWRESLSSRLNQELPKDIAPPRERVHWLALHLCEYVDRWTGFVEHPAVAGQPPSFAFDSGIFAVIEVAIELIQREIAGDLPSAVQAPWRNFVQCYQKMRDAQDLASRRQLLRLANEFASSVH